MSKQKLKTFLLWLVKQGIARDYHVEEDKLGDGADNIIRKYIKEKKNDK